MLKNFECSKLVNNRYRIEKVLFSGPYELYSGYDLIDNKQVCIRRESSENIYAIENSKMQIRLCALCNSFIKIYNIINKEKYTYIVMESWNGTPLSKIGAELSWQDILRIMQPVFQAIYAAHKCGILLLQDIDYANTYITNNNQVKLVRDLRNRIFHLGTNERTPIFGRTCAPECYSNEIKDTYTDVYTVAAVLYTLIAKCPVYDPLRRMRGLALDSISKHCPDFPVDKEEAILKALELSVESRTKTIAELYNAIF